MAEQDLEGRSTPSQKETLSAALERIELPRIGANLISRGIVRNVTVCDGLASVEVLLPIPPGPARGQIEDTLRLAATESEGIHRLNVKWPQAVSPVQRAGAGAPGPDPQSPLVPGVKHVIAVGSGKGGVGKSTVAVNLAASLALGGARVGLLDADVYGPSIPMMMGIRRQPDTLGGKMLPLRAHGIRLMSLGFLMPDDSQYVIWRGPMVGGAVRQMLADVDWGTLDYLLVDLPPGTGDAQLTLAQSVSLTGAVVVMTSQDVAVNIASKAVGMFRKLNVPILGVVGNMDSFSCPKCGELTPIFTRGGSESAAAQLGVPFLGAIPLDPAAVEHGDQGVPTVVAAPDSATAWAFRQVATQLEAALPQESAPSNPFAAISGRVVG